MATNFWICYVRDCLYKASTKEFEHPEGGHICPKCRSEDVFPWRKFRCLGCGFEEEQGKFFAFKCEGKVEEADLDEDPMESKLEYNCSEYNNPDCDSKSYEQIDESKMPPKQKKKKKR
ncbi:hypothetical protein K8R04_02160 [Candidatus Uhrbacteria bacterium]|nr:hypothetical protein [Candidatus Uhrbacteria bacterium]